MRPPVVREAALIANIAQGWLEGASGKMLAQHDREETLIHGDVDALSFACPGAMLQGCGSGERDLQPDDPVREYHRCVARFARPSLQGQPWKAGHALDQIVVGGARRVGASLAEAERTNVDDLRIDLAQIFI